MKVKAKSKEKPKEEHKKKNKFKLEPGFRQFLRKTFIFIALFMIFSAIIGTKIFTNNFIDTWKIGIYARIGYILLFSIAGFILLYRKKLMEFSHYKYHPRDTLMLVVSVMMLVGFYIVELYSSQIPMNIFNLVAVHVLGLSIFFFLALGVYGISFVKHFLKKFKKELLYFLIFGVIVYSLMKTVWSLWPYLSLGVLESVKFLLKLIGIPVAVLGSNTISVNGFAVQIAEACSGIYSIFIFSALYIFIVLIDWNKINKVKASLVFIPAVLGAFAFNIIRVFVLMLVGSYISREIALGLYHSYSGMIFFLIYFALFWGLLYRWMKK